MVVTQWFLPDKWIVKRFTIDGMSDTGPVRLKGEVGVLDFKATIPSNEFLLDPALVSGYEKQTASSRIPPLP